MTAFRRTLRSSSDLADAGLITPERVAEIAAVEARYAVAVTPAIAELIDASDADDPIARQFIPDPREFEQLMHKVDHALQPSLNAFKRLLASG